MKPWLICLCSASAIVVLAALTRITYMLIDDLRHRDYGVAAVSGVVLLWAVLMTVATVLFIMDAQ